MAGRLGAVLAGLLWAATAARGAPVLYLRPLAVLSPGELTLAAIAEVRGGEPREAAELAALALGSVPGRAAFLPPLEVRRRVERAWRGRVDLVGAGVALLPVGRLPEGTQAQAAALLGALGRAAAGLPGWLEVDLLSPLPATAGEVRLPSGLPEGQPLSGRLQVGMGEASVLVFVRPFAAVARAARDLPVGWVLGSQDVEFVEQDLSGLRGGYLTFADLRESYRLAAPAARGTLLGPSQLARHLLVRTGERVVVVVVRPGLSITLSGKAWSSGGPGETVEVSLRDPRRRFQGTVSDTGEVLVERL